MELIFIKLSIYVMLNNCDGFITWIDGPNDEDVCGYIKQVFDDPLKGSTTSSISTYDGARENEDFSYISWRQYMDSHSCKYNGYTAMRRQPVERTTTTTTPKTTTPLRTCGIKSKRNFHNDISKWICDCEDGYAGDPYSICAVDSDSDGWPDRDIRCNAKNCRKDNCKSIPNSGQEDCDDDDEGDICDATPGSCSKICGATVCSNDLDKDGVENDVDKCIYEFNPTNLDSDDDGHGDACDNCPTIKNVNQEDENKNYIGNACDKQGTDDVDNDGIIDELDNCEGHKNHNQLDSDLDGVGDACDPDDDNDGVPDAVDNCPFCPNKKQTDSDGNGIGNVCEDGDYDCDCLSQYCEFDPCPYNNRITRVNFYSYLIVLILPDIIKEVRPKWIIKDGGKEIVQINNADPAIAVGKDVFEGVFYAGTMFVNSKSDDDFIGFVFGYKDSSNYYVVTWKKLQQPFVYTTFGFSEDSLAQSRVILKAVRSKTGPGKAMTYALWVMRDIPEQTKVLFKSSKIPWKEFQPYRYEVFHQPKIGLIHFKIYQGTTLIVDSGKVTDFSHQGGRVGVYCFSQEKVIWSNIQYKCVEDALNFDDAKH